MKKWLLGLFMACMLLCTCTALADSVELSLIDNKVDKTVEWISGTDYTLEGEYGKRAVYDADGRRITQPVYNFFTDVYVDRGLLVGTDSEGDWGVLNLQGDILVPFDYKDNYIFNEYWVMCTPHSSSAKLEFWNMQEGELALTLSAKQYEQGFSAPGSDILLIEDTSGKVTVYNGDGEKIDTTDSLYGYSGAESVEPYEMLELSDGMTMVDENGTMLLAPGDYTYLATEDGWYFRAGRGREVGVIDANGTVIVPFDKDNELRYSSWGPALHPGYVAGGYASAVRDDHLFFYDVYGNLTASYDYSFKDGEFISMHASAYTTKNEGQAIILAADGRETTVRYDKGFRVLDNGSGYLFESVDSDYDYALYDWHGKQLLPHRYSDFQISTDGRYLLAKRDDSKYAELFEITYPDVWYEMYDASRFDGSAADNAASKRDQDQPSLTTLAGALEQSVKDAPEKESSGQNLLVSGGESRPGSQGGNSNILTNNRPTPEPAVTAAPTPTPEPTAAPTEAPAPVQQPTAAPVAAPSGNAEVDALLNSAIILLDADAAANGQAIAQLIATAAGMLEGTPAGGILQSAAMLAGTNASSNAVGIRQLIESARTMY